MIKRSKRDGEMRQAKNKKVQEGWRDETGNK